MLHIIYPAIVITEEGVPYKENNQFVRDEETDIPFMIKQSKFDIRYLIMGAYAYSDTEGKEIEGRPMLEHILDRIATITELTPEIVDKPFPLFEQGEYDAETKRFFLYKRCPSEKENETLLSIFIDYMIRRIKKGYFMKHSMTPAEICAEVALEEDEKNLFAVYDKARYAGQRGLEEITDAMVGELQMVNRKRNQ